MENSNVQEEGSSRAWLSRAMVLLAVIVAGGVVAYVQGKQDANAPVPPTDTPPAPTDGQPVVDASSYKDGAYSSTGNYVSPGGPESIDVTLTVENGIVTAASVESNASLDASKFWQETFISNYQPLVIGKSLSELKLGNVSGSSLTPKGFNDALEDIRQQAGA